MRAKLENWTPERPLTLFEHKQRDVLAMIVRYQGEHGYPPTFREIGSACHMPSTDTVNRHLRRLADSGYIEQGQGPRAIRVLLPFV